VEPIFLLKWLNDHADPRLPPMSTAASRKRIVDLLHRITKVDALITEAIEAQPRRNFWKNSPAGVDREIESIQQILGEYPMKPTVYLFGMRGGGLKFDLRGAGRRPPGENRAVDSVIDLAKDGLLTRVRSCVCGRWYFADRKNQSSCSPACRHRKYEQTESFKAMRRKYMREYYALKKSGKVK
jgi:hypothetical protein